MDFRDILGKFAEQPKIETVEETPVVENKLPSLKNIFEALSNKTITEAEQVTMEPAKQNTQVIKQGTKVLGTVTNPALAANIKAAIGKGEMSLAGDAIKEDDLDEKAVSKAQQKFMGMVHAAQKGKKPASAAVAKVAKSMKKGDVKDFAKTKHKGLPDKVDEADIASTKSQDTMGAGLGAGRSDKAFETKQVNESMNKLEAAYHQGKHDGLKELAARVKHYEDMEEAKKYYEGYKEGLDECYGMGVKNEPIVGMEESIPVMDAEMGEGNAFTAALAKADKGEKFTVGGKTFTDRSNYDAKIDELAFESLDKQLAALLEDAEPVVNEGLSVSMSTGNENSPNTVSVTGTDDEAAKLLSFIKQVGLGGMGADKEGLAPGEPAVAVVSDYGAPKFSGNDGMAALLKKVGADDDEHNHKHEATCNECGMMEASCGCDKEPVEEVQSQDQKLYATTSESDNSEDDGFDDSARNTELDNAGKPAVGGATNEDGAEAPGSNPVGELEQEEAEEVAESTEKLDEWANNAGQKGTDTAFEQDIEFMTKVISGGLNKPKVTGQTTVPVIAGQDARDGEPEDLGSWIKLAGIKPAVKK